MTIKLLIILLIFLNQCNVSIIEEDKPIVVESTEGEFDIIENNNDTWLVNFIRSDNNRYISCQVMPIEPRVLIGDAECIYHASKEGHWQIVIYFYHNSMRFPNMAFVQDKNIFYNTNLTNEYNPNLRKIAILITDQPVIADNNKSLLVGTAQLAYEEVPGYNEKNQIKKIIKSKADSEETNFSKCFMSPFKGRNIIVRCYELGLTYTVCKLKKTEYVISQYDNLSDFLMCHVKSSRKNVFLAGVLSRVNKLTLNSYYQIIDLKFENVEDLGRIIRKKVRKWLAENPEQKTYPLW
ncbi:uncharacterized protein LOC123266193 isoform X2 [Cotesia glomerata]|uniref:uncharacterized protein LOC123266193 isoform X2 n=1 Tax=Cotesia glomerata TaxID=32391 RepID=UPI001D028420|nr:uncharacterized protein LOC123266193 isoform X2 [Cotesia glomerata]